jgi:pimeloyl-ACP methyl ester carboxylesterase
VSDIELLRNKLGIEKWVVFGGSWYVYKTPFWIDVLPLMV